MGENVAKVEITSRSVYGGKNQQRNGTETIA